MNVNEIDKVKIDTQFGIVHSVDEGSQIPDDHLSD